MRIKPLSTTLATLAAAAMLGSTALAISQVSVGMLNGRSQEFDGTMVTVTGTVYVRGEGHFTQLCDEAMTCIYLHRGPNYDKGKLSDLSGTRVTLAGRFHADGIVKNTPVKNVLDVGF
jgi:hypothetical protein